VNDRATAKKQSIALAVNRKTDRFAQNDVAVYYFSHRYACLFLLDKIELGDGKKLLTPKVEGRAILAQREAEKIN
jgi:hypothetical protein